MISMIEQLPEALEKRPDIAMKLAFILSQYFVTKEEIKKILEEIKRLRVDFNTEMLNINRRLEQQGKRLEEQGKRLEELSLRLEEQGRILEKHSDEIRVLREDFNRGFKSLKDLITALGSRWGIMSEESFRAGLRGIVWEYFGGSVEKWVVYDKEGVVFGYPESVDVDIVIREGEHLLLEIKSHVRKEDVGALYRKGKLYERKTGVKPGKLIFVTPFIEEDAREACKRLKIDVYTSTDMESQRG